MAAAAEAEKWASVAAEAVAEARKLAAVATEAARGHEVGVRRRGSLRGRRDLGVDRGEIRRGSRLVRRGEGRRGAREVHVRHGGSHGGGQQVRVRLVESGIRIQEVVVHRDLRRRQTEVRRGGVFSGQRMHQGLKEEKGEEHLVITNPKLASLIYHCFNIAFLLQVILFMAHVLVYYNASDVWWHAVVANAIVSPLLIAPLYFTPILRDVFIRAFAMAPSNTCSSYLSGKLLLSKKV